MSQKKINSALKEYQKSLGFDSSIRVDKRGGQMRFKKFGGGGSEDEEEVFNGGEIPASVVVGDIDIDRSGSWSGLAGLASNFIGDAVNSYADANERYKQLNNRTRQYGANAFNGVQDNDALLAALSNTPSLSGVGKKDIRNRTVGQDIGSALSTGISAGLSTGNIWVGLGAAALDAGKSILQRTQAVYKGQKYSA